MFLKYNVTYWSVETVRDAVPVLTKEMKEKAVAKAKKKNGDWVEEIEEMGDEDFFIFSSNIGGKVNWGQRKKAVVGPPLK